MNLMELGIVGLGIVFITTISGIKGELSTGTAIVVMTVLIYIMGRIIYIEHVRSNKSDRK